LKNYQLLLALLGIFLVAGSCKRELKKDTVSKTRIEKQLDRGEMAYSVPELGEKIIDSVITELAGNKNDSVNRYFYRRAATAYYNMNLYDKSLHTARKIYNLASQAQDTVDMAKSLFYIGESFYGRANNDSAFYYYAQAENLYKNLDDTRSLGEIVLYKAYVYYNIGEYVLCETEAIRAWKLLSKDDRPTDIYNCYNLIATALDGQNNNNDALTYFKLALKEVERFKEEGYSEDVIALYRVTCYNNMGLVYIKMGDYKKAISIYNNALKTGNIKDISASLYAKLINNLAYAKFKDKDYSQLPDLFFKSLALRDSLNNKSGIITSNINIGEYYLSQQDTQTAITYFKSAYNDANEINSNYDVLNSLKFLSEIDKANSAYYSGKYITVSDSLQEIAKANRDKYARIEYETDRLQDEKEALVKKNSFIIGVSAVILLFIAAIFIIYYLNSKNKELMLVQEQQKANEEIFQLMFEQQNKIDDARSEEKNRIALELHDGILNNIYAVRLNLEFSNRKTDDETIEKRKGYIKQLQGIETEIRSVSHDLSRSAELQQDKSFENILEFMIESQKNNFETLFEAHIDKNIDWENMSNIVKVNIYRIVQEALQNVNKYSNAKHAKVYVKEKGNTVNVTIEDDGIGFDTENMQGGIGLKNLRKRADALNGVLNITSQPGEGTVIKVSFPKETLKK
jgi:signal transduction histidine kinase